MGIAGPGDAGGKPICAGVENGRQGFRRTAVDAQQQFRRTGGRRGARQDAGMGNECIRESQQRGPLAKARHRCSLRL